MNDTAKAKTASRKRTTKSTTKRTTKRTSKSTDHTAEALEAFTLTVGAAQNTLELARKTIEESFYAARFTGREAVDRAMRQLELAKGKLEEAKTLMSGVAEASRERVEALYGQVSEQYRELAAAVRDRVADIDLGKSRDNVLDSIQNNPGRAVMIALAAGFLIGFAVQRSRNS